MSVEIPYFIYNNVSSKRFGILLEAGHRLFSGPERDIEKISVPGRDGDLIIDRGRYKNLEARFNCTFVSAVRTDSLFCMSLKTWLLSRPEEYLPLETSEIPGYFRLAAYSGPLDIDSIVTGFGDFELTFDCKPWLYMKAGQKLQDITQPKSIQNPKGFPCLPYIKITGSGDIRLTVGNLSWDFAGVDEFIEIDSELMDTFKGTLLQNGKKIGIGYPALQPGINHFAWTGNVSKVEVIPRWRTL